MSGRFAAQAGYVPLCGNLLHHAIELQLKCGLIKAMRALTGLPHRVTGEGRSGSSPERELPQSKP